MHKKGFIYFLILIGMTFTKCSEGEISNDLKSNEIFADPYTMAMYPGGMDEAERFIEAQLSTLDASNIDGKVFVQLTVTKTGEILDPAIVKNSTGNPTADALAIEIVKSMPPWIPGTYKLDPIETKIIIPVQF